MTERAVAQFDDGQGASCVLYQVEEAGRVIAFRCINATSFPLDLIAPIAARFEPGDNLIGCDLPMPSATRYGGAASGFSVQCAWPADGGV